MMTRFEFYFILKQVAEILKLKDRSIKELALHFLEEVVQIKGNTVIFMLVVPDKGP